MPLSLFDFDDGGNATPTVIYNETGQLPICLTGTTPNKRRMPKPAKKITNLKDAIPAKYQFQDDDTMESFLSRCFGKKRTRRFSDSASLEGNTLTRKNEDDLDDNVIFQSLCSRNTKYLLFMMPGTGNIYVNTFRLDLDWQFITINRQRGIDKVTIGPDCLSGWRKLAAGRVLPSNESWFVQPEEEIIDVIDTINPYLADFAREGVFKPQLLLQCPSLEILYKAGYKFVEEYRDCQLATQLHYADCIINFHGTSPKNIFKGNKVIWQNCKEVKHAAIIQRLNIALCMQNKFSDSEILHFLNHFKASGNLEDFIGDFDTLARVLAYEWNGRRCFSIEELMRYLDRVDLNEAISSFEAIRLIDDWVRMSIAIGVKPKLDKDSLKREHDVTARIYRIKMEKQKSQMLNSQMVPVCKKLEKYNFQDSKYIIRSIKDYDDLLDEARQQSNCVASYGDRIIKGQSLIFVMRFLGKPDESYITIELTPDRQTIRQKYLSHNRRVTSEADLAFINRWHQRVKNI